MLPPIHQLIACPYCRARIDQSCKTRSGHTTYAHACRLTPRLCPCGALLAPNRGYCDHCRDRATQESKNASGRRRRAARRHVVQG